MRQSVSIKNIIILLSISLSTYSQQSDSLPIRKSYLDFLEYDSTCRTNLLNFSFQYNYFQKNKPFRRGGLGFELGLNLARFFSKKIIFGICLDSRLFESHVSQNFDTQFQSDFNNNFISSQPTQADTLVSKVLYNTINNNGIKIRGDHHLFYGVSFSPFPDRFGGLLLEFKTGGSSYLFYGNYDAAALNKDHDNIPVMLITRKNSLYQLSFNPYKFFRSKETNVYASEPYEFYKFFVISLCYEKFSLEHSTLNNLLLTNFIQQNFISKYSNQYYIGIKIGLGIY
jgi:hypothetical protein